MWTLSLSFTFSLFMSLLLNLILCQISLLCILYHQPSHYHPLHLLIYQIQDLGWYIAVKLIC